MIFSGPPVEIPGVNLAEFVLRRADAYGDTPAVVDVSGGGQCTYAELAATARGCAAGLRARGFGPGDVLAVLAPNCPEYPAIAHAATGAGGAVVVLNPLDTERDLAARLTESGARLLVVAPADLERATALAAEVGVEEVLTTAPAPGARPFTALADDAATGGPVRALDPARDPAALLHSSGSTGHPKTVVLTHRNLVAKALLTSMVAPIEPGEVVLAVPPFHHAFGLTMMMNATLLQGGTLVTMPRFDPEGFLRAVQDHRVTRLYVVPTMAVLLARSPLVEEYDLSSLRSIVSGGAALDPEIARLVRARIGCRIAQGYGLTESMVSFMQSDHPATESSVGTPAPGVECRVVDTGTGEELNAEETGEVLIRGPQVMRGYLAAGTTDTAATAEVLGPDGFLRTGDLGYVGSDGELVLVDRIKELIKYKGQQVSPVELESVLLKHPGVADAAVVGVPDEEASEIPKGFVVAKGATTAEELMAYVAERVAPYKKIRRIEFVDRIPRTPVGKVERRALRDRAA
ncbi:AMP-binding protein [Actinosynnema pretiosum subsp. pretiosum]|uniref:AMP-binding protein n=1 Tax=Actinosynnema pretiosum subsp. pretiosum TaxID=103721 RepID=A0AA45L810_9PSEU|nr:4-coumarate:CoA ligase [Actinosynnema pretiosum subsp. pretiosum]QUF04495.1 AMP-binding protein [Actinosynnema pretiosum subsp. pretiosum]